MNESIKKIAMFKKEITEYFAQFQEKQPSSPISQDEIKFTMNHLLYTFGYYAIFTCHPYFDKFDKSIQHTYINKFLLAYINDYSWKKLEPLSSAKIEKNVFFSGWCKFISDLPNANITGNKTSELCTVIKMYFPSGYFSYENDTNIKNRFWEKYVLRQQDLTQYTPAIPSKNTLIKEELPFYYLLFTIYYFSNFRSDDDDIFKSFGKDFFVYRKYGNINKNLLWCVSCFYEWYDYYSRINSNRTHKAKLLSYIPGISSFLGHFGFFWHQGIQWQKESLFNLLDTVNFKLTKWNENESYQFIATFLAQHRYYTQPAITGKEPLNKARKDEKKQELSAVTSYIQKELESYFHLPSNHLDKYFKIKFEKSEIQNPIGSRFRKLYPSGKIRFLNLEIRQFEASIFLIFARVENDLLPYLNAHIVYTEFFNLFKECIISSTEYLDMGRDVQEIMDDFWDNFEILNHIYNNMDYIQMYNNLKIYLDIIQSTFPFSNTDWEEYLFEIYLQMLCNTDGKNIITPSD